MIIKNLRIFLPMGSVLVSFLISFSLFAPEARLEEYTRLIHKGLLRAPKIQLNSYNSYTYDTPNDSGTGASNKSLVLFVVPLLELTNLPAIVHDSLLFDSISDEGACGILTLYTSFKYAHKQIFMAFDKHDSYNKELGGLIEQHAVLRLTASGCELFGRDWNKK